MTMQPLRAALLAALFPLVVGGCSASTAATQPAAVPAAPAAAAVRGPGFDFTQLAKDEGPAVVNISVTKEVATQMPQLDPNDPFYQFFRRFQVPVPRQAPERGIGSGFIISPDGYILTNAHVVDGVKEVHVKLTDRREFTAKVAGTDPKTDVALIKIDAANLPTVRIGSARNVEVGQWVVAMGSPFGFENSLTAGVVSAKSRSLPGDGYVPFIQTDVAVNPGNSGGPLFDMNGNVIGINSQIYSRSGGYMGVSFAIPIDVAMHVKDELAKSGHVTRGRIGVAIQSVNQSLAQSFGLAKPEGALVSSVADNSPAARAGIRPGDVILAWNGKTIDDSAELPGLVADTPPGKHATVKLWRNGAEQTLGVTVARMADEKAASAEGANSDANSGKLGLAVQQSDRGLVVAGASGPAARAGVREGDVILAVNNQPVKNVEQLRRLVDKAGRHVALLVQREDAKVYVPVDLG
ncbi:MAG: DegQ family serine endoprotease [Betaproteobacteria bacterium]|nr:MAG: DegQ family serine endoprotease [Betaproteobacteria bacterium]